MLDRDLAELYGVETRVLNQAVKRNINRFPEDFMFQLTREECLNIYTLTDSQNNVQSSRSQIVTMKTERGKNIKYLPYAFTEQGVAMLSGILRSNTAIEINIRIMRAFVAMRRFLLANVQVFQRIETLEMRQIATDNKLNQVLSKLDDGTATKIEGIFYEGEVFSARAFIEDLIKSAQREIILIDAYVDATILNLLTLRAPDVAASVYTGQIKPALQKAHTLHNQQYPVVPIRLQTYSSNFHDRFLIIDDAVYHVGASLKDLGKRLFAFTRMEIDKSIITAQI
ncbi:MAG: ORF6N domain-containing protein [Bacteroidaceae bacterium]|nr:ORF6N domain-containing protein [Bacteroidaceae bacterium]